MTNMRLLQVLRERDLKQKDLAILAGLPGSTVSRIVRGSWLPDERQKLAIARALKARADWLFEGGGDG